MRRTIRGRGARGFVEPGKPHALPKFVDLLKDGSAIIYGHSERSVAERMEIFQGLLAAGCFDGRASPLLCMRIRRPRA